MSSKEKEEITIKQVLEHLYFVEGLEELRFLDGMKEEHVWEWSRTKKENLCRAIFALINNVPPQQILEELSATQTTPIV